MQDDEVFKALADPTRRLLLDALFTREGRSLGELESVVAEHVEMTRFGVSKHLRLLESAGLVLTRKQGREKLHYLNPVPIQLIHDRWINKYAERRVTALTELKRNLEEKTGATPQKAQSLNSQWLPRTRQPQRSRCSRSISTPQRNEYGTPSPALNSARDTATAARLSSTSASAVRRAT